MLEEFVDRCPTDDALVAQIADLLGSTERKRSALAGMRQTIAQTAGERSAYSFLQRSVLRTVFWEKLLAHAANSESARRILAARTEVDFRIGPGNVVSVDLAGLPPSDLVNTTEGVLALELEEELKAMSFYVAGHPLEHAERAGSSSEAWDLTQRIRENSRQEERIAMLMKVAIDDPPLGRLVLHGYPFDRAKFMKSALRQITAALNAAIHSKGVGSDVIWAGLVRRLTKEVFPYNKGVLLLAFSKHLGHIPPIRDFIEGEIRRSQSMYVIPYRTVIRKHLQHGMGGA